MSIRLMTLVWDMPELSPVQKLVFLALADWSSDDGVCWPSIDRLATKTSVSRRAIQLAIRFLEEKELIRRDEVSGKGNKYWILLTRAPGAPLPVQDMHPTRAPGAPNTLVIRQEEKEDISISSKEKRGSRLNPDWQPTEKDILHALDKGFTFDEIRVISELFRDNWISSSLPTAVKKDWAAAWRTWIGNEVKWKGQRNGKAATNNQKPGARSIERISLFLTSGLEDDN